MRLIIIITALVLSGCSHEPPPLNEPGSKAETWNLNDDHRSPVTNDLNDLVKEPSVGGTR